jgi:hypothetical protein
MGRAFVYIPLQSMQTCSEGLKVIFKEILAAPKDRLPEWTKISKLGIKLMLSTSQTLASRELDVRQNPICLNERWATRVGNVNEEQGPVPHSLLFA